MTDPLSLPIWRAALEEYQAKGTPNERDLATFALGLLEIAATSPEGAQFLARRSQEALGVTPPSQDGDNQPQGEK